MHIETAQNVIIEREVASVGHRILSTILDFIFIAAYCMLILFIMSFTNAEEFAWLMLPVLFYSLLFEVLFNGQTLGKMILKIKVVKVDGMEAGFVQFIIRWLFRLIDVPFYGLVGIITMAINGKGQRLGDIVAGTMVVSTQTNKMKLPELEIPENYSVTFPEVEMLGDKEMNITLNVLTTIDRSYSERNNKLALKLQKALTAKLNIETNMPPRRFLKKIVSDYNYIYSEKEKNQNLI